MSFDDFSKEAAKFLGAATKSRRRHSGKENRKRHVSK